MTAADEAPSPPGPAGADTAPDPAGPADAGAGSGPSGGGAGAGPGRTRLGQRVAEVRRRGLDPEERRRVMDAVALRTEDGWLTQFGVMLSLSVLVAVMGLSAGSAAVVIGAMLLAPLMTPVMGVAAALAMALPRHLARSLVIVVVSSLLAGAASFLLASLVPDGPLTEEVLARTRPDLRDLLVALAAGAAGAYATVRSDVSSALPGVAVAVALVPPLAAVGVTTEAGRSDLATGAMLLYLANLLAIILIATLVFLLTGFVPPRRLKEKGLRVVAGGVIVAAATATVAVPLALATITAAEAGQQRESVHRAAGDWVAGTADELDEVRIDGDQVRIRVSGPHPPPMTDDLEEVVRQVLGPTALVQVRWTRTEEPARTDGAGVDAQDTERGAVRAVIEAWLAEAGTGGFEVERLDLEPDLIRLDLRSTEPPPPVDELSARLEAELGVAVPIEMSWTQRTTVRSDGQVTPLSDTRRRLEAEARDWARSRDGFTVDELHYDGLQVVVALSGPAPVDVADLEARLADLAAAAQVQVWFTPRQRLDAGG